jgi:hypothetical protein
MQINKNAVDLVKQIGQATRANPLELNAAQLKQLEAGFTATALDLMTKYDELKAAGATPGIKRLLDTQTVGATIDGFVIAAHLGAIKLPAGQGALDIVNGGVAEFIRRGFDYSIDIPKVFGSFTYTANELGPDGKPAWEESLGR